ncbi:hypothetical protein AO258_21555 [Pseudomonas syringae ICMP 19498]|nr:hypothetical protein AO258_21555 [Pseudomonas syringae ICMP 19498]
MAPAFRRRLEHGAIKQSKTIVAVLKRLLIRLLPLLLFCPKLAESIDLRKYSANEVFARNFRGRI